MFCLPCTTGAHYDCPDITPVDPDAKDSIGVFLCCCEENLIGKTIEGPKEYKTPETLKDVESTGRKRAALIKPIKQGVDICEWAYLARAGGGVKPIIGCAGNFATNIHHGPDKSTLNNDPEINLHRICATCHNRWHTLNDKYYGDRPDHGAPFLPLDKECLPHDRDLKVTELEVQMNDFKWLAGEFNEKG